MRYVPQGVTALGTKGSKVLLLQDLFPSGDIPAGFIDCDRFVERLLDGLIFLRQISRDRSVGASEYEKERDPQRGESKAPPGDPVPVPMLLRLVSGAGKCRELAVEDLHDYLQI